MTDASNPYEPQGDPYTPPPAGEPVLPPAPASAPATGQPPVYQPPAAAVPPAPEQPGYAQAPYPGAAAPGQPQAPAAKNQAQVWSIISLVAGFASIFIFPFIAGVVGIGLGANAIRTNNAARATGTYSGAYTGMAIGGIALGAIGIVLALVVNFMLR